MKKKKIDDIIYKTASTLGYPPQVVADLIFFSFASLKQALLSGDHGSIRLLHLGAFISNPRAVYNEISNQIRLIRHRRSPENLERLRVLLKLRHIANDYSKSRKFKQRFGSWHYKAAGGQDSDSAGQG